MKKKSTKPKIVPEIKVEDILLKNRKLFLYGDIKPENTVLLIKNLMAINLINQEPIFLFIDSPGGHVASGFSLINTMKLCKSPIYTVITGEACSMAGLISIVGKQRLMSKNTFWMGHDIHGGAVDYSGKIEYRADYLKKCWKMIEDHIHQYTKLDSKEIQILRNGELWFNPEECLVKGIIDKII